MNDINDLLAIIDMAQDAVEKGFIDEAELHLAQAERLINNLSKSAALSNDTV